MANPVVVVCTANTWVKVATGITSSVIHKLSVAPSLYKQTYRTTLDPAPTNDTDAAVLFESSSSETFSNSGASDVYVKAVGADGSVRVDL